MATKPIPCGQGFCQSDRSSPSSDQATATTEHDVLIDIYPRGYDIWTGSAAQLVAEGLISEDFKWPIGRNRCSWESNGFDYWLYRRRPDGHKGPMRSWLAIDHWCLRRTLTSQGRDGFATARLYAKRQELAEEMWRNTAGYRDQWSRYWTACQDSAFQRFKALIVPEQKRRGRKPKMSPTPPAASA